MGRKPPLGVAVPHSYGLMLFASTLQMGFVLADASAQVLPVLGGKCAP